MKSLPFLACFLVLLSFSMLAYADASLVDPVVVKAKPNGMLDAGSISPGEKVELIFSRSSGYGKDVLWNQARISIQGSPNGIQAFDSENKSDSLITRVQTNPLTKEGMYTFDVRLIGDEGVLEDETYTVKLNVKKGLLKGSLSAENVKGRVNETLQFSVLLVNDSSAPVNVLVQPALPTAWSEAKTIAMKPHSFVTVPVDVTPRFAGPKTFDIALLRGDNRAAVDTLHATLVADPTLKDRYSAGLYGFPFFAISLVSHYLANAFFSLLL
jgi:hypothetical protein